MDLFCEHNEKNIECVVNGEFDPMEDNPPQNKYKEFLVEPKGARREALSLVGVIGLIVLLMGLRFSQVGSDASSEHIRPYQIKDLHLKNQAPTLYRSLLGGVADVVTLRKKNGSWPSINTLKEEVLPPFANIFLPIDLRGFVWKVYEGDGYVDYFGINAGAAAAKKKGGDPLENSFILRIVDLQSEQHPHPHLGKDNNVGERFTSQIWMNPQITDYPGEKLVERGWKWIVAVNSMAGEKKMVLSEEPGQ